DEASGKKIIVRVGRFGPLVQIGSSEDEEKPRFASLRQGQMIETITLEEALELFRLPKTVGVFEDKDMTVAIGRFGPYIRHDGSFYSLPKDVDPHKVEETEAIEIIKIKRQKDIDTIIKTFEEDPDVRIENGRWGPFIRYGKLNIKIPKDKVAEDLTFEDIKVLADNQPVLKKSDPKSKATAKKKPAAKKATTAKAKTTKKAKTIAKVKESK